MHSFQTGVITTDGIAVALVNVSLGYPKCIASGVVVSTNKYCRPQYIVIRVRR